MSSGKTNFAQKLQSLIDTRPTDPKVNVWKEQLSRLQANTERPKQKKNKKQSQRKSRPMKTNQPNSTQIRYPKEAVNKIRKIKSNVENVQSNSMSVASLQSNLEFSIARTLACMLDPDAGPCRYPDMVNDPTACYKSVIEIPISADTAQNDGRFTIIVQPILGSSFAPSAYKIGYVDCSKVNPDLSLPESYLAAQMEIRSDPNLNILLSGQPIDVSYNLTSPANSTLQPFDILTLSSATGVNYDGFTVLTPTLSPSVLFTPAYTMIRVPVGQFAFSWLAAANQAGVEWNTANNMQKVQSVVADNLVTLSIFAFQYPDNTTSMPGNPEIIDRYSITLVGSAINAGTFGGPTITTGKVFSINSNGAMMNTVTGFGATTGSDLGVLLSLMFNINVPYKDGYSTALGLYLQTPSMANAYAQGFVHNIRFTGTQILNQSPAYANEGLVQRIRPTAMKAHLAFTAPQLNIGGQVAAVVFPGSFQKQVFSNTGFTTTSFAKVSIYNKPNKLYVGPVAKGAYAIWAPEVYSDYQCISYNESLNYNYPFIVITGNISSTSGPISAPFATLRVVTNFEYFTNSTVVETRKELGSDNYMQAVLAAVAQTSQCHENPKHKDFFKGLLSTAGK